MAATMTEKPVNGNYGGATNYNNPEAYQQNPNNDGQTNASTGEGSHNSARPTPSSIEVGWFFVEQYYNTMSKEPTKLYLYYTKKSQFVAGNEAEKVNVAVGQRKISEMIKEMDIQDCKVRVTNVDSQESADSILIQVIGEMSNRAAPHRKFVQTFVLATQPTGYYVLNDIFRYIVDEDEEESPADVEGGQSLPIAEKEATPATLTSSSDPIEQQKDVNKLDDKLKQETVAKDEHQSLPPTASLTNGVKSDLKPEEKTSQAGETATSVKEEETPASEEKTDTAIEEVAKPESPRDPEPTPIASSPKPANAAPVDAPAAPPKPAAPKTWANLVASKGVATPAIGQAAKAPNAPSAPKPSNAPAKENATPSTTANDDPAKSQINGNSGWQTAGLDKQRHGRQASQSISSGQDNVLAYVKNVTDKVDASILKTTLAGFGKLAYFDVSRQKNCAFVEFAEPAAYHACVAANPHNIGGEHVFVEERRPRANAYGGNFNGRGGMRGGRGGPNDRPTSQGRGAFNKEGGRGGHQSRGGRDGAMTPRGRGGQPQAA